MWDLTEEHKNAYNEDICLKIDLLTDLFDEILEYIQDGLYPSMMCVDVFLIDEDIEISMMKIIQKYYNSYIDEECQKQPKNKFSTKLSFQKNGEGEILQIFKNIFTLDNITNRWKGTSEIHYNNVKSVTDKLHEFINCEVVEKYSLNKKDLTLLEDIYIGILFSGSVIKCGKYAILILTGCNE